MADSGDALYTKLVGTAGIISQTSSRIRPYRLHQGESFPAIVYEQVTGGEDYATADGFSSLSKEVYDIRCLASTEATAKALSRLVKDTIAFQTWTTSNVTVRVAMCTDPHLLNEHQEIEAGQEATDWCFVVHATLFCEFS